MKLVEENYDVVVCGGGLAGFCAAVAAARQGARTALVQNRPVLGGNSSSEIGVTPHGAAAFHAYARETGIISEALIQERSLNHAEIYENGWTNSVWDLVLYDIAHSLPNLTLHLNTNFEDVVMVGDHEARGLLEAADEADLSMGFYHRASRNPTAAKIQSIVASVQNAELQLKLTADVFIDCTGDGLVADRAGCEWRMGSESKEEFQEPHAPDRASTDTMGNSIHFRCRNVGRPVPFRAPDWAMHYQDASFFYDQGRIPKDERGGFWWLEIGVPSHTIHDNEDIRHELTRHALGVWEWMKNSDDIMKERTANYALDWIGQVPGKRESRRIIGQYLLKEDDVQTIRKFDDEIAFGGWFIDLHTPGGLLAPTSEPTAATDAHDTFDEYSVKSYCGPYGIPLRICIAKDVDNLMMAGRNVSATHAALGTVRVMGTTALMGEACGTAAATIAKRKMAVADVLTPESLQEVQQTLLRNGCFLPNVANEDPKDLAREAKVTASSTAAIAGCTPEDPAAHNGLAVWKDQPQYNVEQMTVRKGQLIARGPEALQAIELCLTNTGDTTPSIPIALHEVDHIWDYRIEAGEPLACGEITVSPGQRQWIRWDVNLPASSKAIGNWVRVDLSAHADILWHTCQNIIPGHTGVYQIGKNKYRRFGNGSTLAYRVEPAQTAFRPEQVISGVCRPYRQTNLWLSDPTQPLPQWLELAWEKDRRIGEIQLTFPGHLLREYHAYGPFYRDAQTACDYRVSALVSGDWIALLDIRDNVQRQRRHVLRSAVTTAKLRVEVLSTHGDPAAAIYEVRCYEDPLSGG